MTFWDLKFDSDATALLDENGRACCYGELAAASDTIAEHFSTWQARSMGFLLFDPSMAAVQFYLGGLRSRRYVPLLLQTSLHQELFAKLVELYRPHWIACPPGHAALEGIQGYQAGLSIEGLTLHVATSRPEPGDLHDDLALLLSTSGSTGAQKLVRLSYDAIDSNAGSIAAYLGLTSEDRAITTLPLAYSFGLSILNSHLAAGGSLVMTDKTLLTREFWEIAETSNITSLSGVPGMFDMLRRAGLEKRGLSSLRMLTQAGGKLREDLQKRFHALCEQLSAEFFVMYGQTEASPRISYIPPDQLPAKIGSIGVPVPGGALDTDPATGELIYTGPNVMMGYAEKPTDLRKGDECGGILHTGDIGYQDDDGFFFLTGRMKRFVKLSGARVNLDDVESSLCEAFGQTLACLGEDDRLDVIMPDTVDIETADVTGYLRDRFDIFPGLVSVRRLASLPYTGNGKLDYLALSKVTADDPV